MAIVKSVLYLFIYLRNFDLKFQYIPIRYHLCWNFPASWNVTSTRVLKKWHVRARRTKEILWPLDC